MVKKTILAIAIAAVSTSVFAQQKVEEATLVVFGEAPTRQEATVIALRSAIEQTFGVFVSANTQILNNELIKDEIATVSSGNIKEYKEITTTTLQNGNIAVTLEAVVSVTKLVSYARSVGSSAEFAGASFGMNMKLRELNKANEEKAIANMISQFEALMPNMYDYTLELGEPKIADKNDVIYELPAKVFAAPNENAKMFLDILIKTLTTLSLPSSEVEQYKTANLPVYEFQIGSQCRSNSYVTGDNFIFRSKVSVSMIDTLITSDIYVNIFNFQIIDNLGGISMIEKCTSVHDFSKQSMDPDDDDDERYRYFAGRYTDCNIIGLLKQETTKISSKPRRWITQESRNCWGSEFLLPFHSEQFNQGKFRLDLILEIPKTDITKYNNFTITHK